MAGGFRVRRISLVLYTLSFFIGIQFVSFIWLNARGKRDNILGISTPQNRINTSRQQAYSFGPSISESPPKITKIETTTQAEGKTTQGQTTSKGPLSEGNVSLIKTRVSSKILKPTTKSVDMENDYYPLVNFSFVWPEIVPKLNDENEYFLVVLVNSAANGKKYRARRTAIRKAWANMSQCEALKMDNSTLKQRWIVVFSLGKADNESENQANLEEARIHNDILLGEFKDHYLNNVVKVYMGELWVSRMPSVRYILKTDDDVYVRVPLVIAWLAEQNYPRQFYGGAPYFNFNVDRNPKGKWAVSKKYFNEDIFPAFCAGAFYVLSTDLLSKMFNYVRRRKPFHTDDAYVGIAARDLGIPVKRIPGLLLEDNMHMYLGSFNDCKLFKARGFGHNIEPPLMNTVFNRLNDLCLKNWTC